MKKLLFIFFTAGLIQGFSSCSHKDTPDNALALIPQPQEMKVGTDHFKLTRRAFQPEFQNLLRGQLYC